MRKLTVVAFILKQKMKMTQEENFPNVAKQPRPLDRREKPQVHSDKKVTAHARCGQRSDGRLVPLLLVGILPHLIVSFRGIRARKSKWRAMRHREVTHRGGCPGNRRAVDAHPQIFLLNLLLPLGVVGFRGRIFLLV